MKNPSSAKQSQARKVESHLVTFSPAPPVFLLNRVIETYGGYPEKALSLFLDMNRSGVYASEVTFASVLGSCGAMLALCLWRQVHGLIVKYGFVGNVILESSLVDVYGKCQVIKDGQKMFDEIKNPIAVSWNVIVRRYLEMDDGTKVGFMFFKMFQTAVRPFNFTFSNALIACSSIFALKEGKQIHGVAIKMGFEDDELPCMLHMCASFGDLLAVSQWRDPVTRPC
uniref:Pentatricopeptide repeat-containing protein n=1 Tax=Quercus lobata TaxID=97700 RepID=A0A7N2LJ42_QUELO